MGRKSICKICGREVKHRTHKGVCLSCSMNKQIAVIRSLRSKKGKYYKKWKRNLIEALKQK